MRRCSISLIMKVKSLSCVQLFATPWIVACPKLLRPWHFQGKSTGVGCHFLLQGIFPTQGSNPGLSHCRQSLYHLSHQGSPGKRRRKDPLNAYSRSQGTKLHFLEEYSENKQSHSVTHEILTTGWNWVLILSTTFTQLNKAFRSHLFYWVCPSLLCTCAKLLRPCPTLCDPVYHSPPGSSVHGILQARRLEWVAMPFSRGSSQPRY